MEKVAEAHHIKYIAQNVRKAAKAKTKEEAKKQRLIGRRRQKEVIGVSLATLGQSTGGGYHYFRGVPRY